MRRQEVPEGEAASLTRRTPMGVRIVGWFLFVSGGWTLLSLLIAAGRRAPHGALLIGIPSACVSLGLGCALLRGRKWTYIPVLLLLLASEGWAAWFFFVQAAERYSLAVRLLDGLLIMVLAAVPIVLMLNSSARNGAVGG
jgi:hypothetical protein